MSDKYLIPDINLISDKNLISAINLMSDLYLIPDINLISDKSQIKAHSKCLGKTVYTFNLCTLQKHEYL